MHETVDGFEVVVKGKHSPPASNTRAAINGRRLRQDVALGRLMAVLTPCRNPPRTTIASDLVARGGRGTDSGHHGSWPGSDRGEKLRNYQQLGSVRAVIIVAHDVPRVTMVARRGAGWETIEARAGIVRVAEPTVEIDVDSLYAALAQL